MNLKGPLRKASKPAAGRKGISGWGLAPFAKNVKQTSRKLEDDPSMKAEIWRNNYDSVGGHEDFVREHFAEE